MVALCPVSTGRHLVVALARSSFEASQSAMCDTQTFVMCSCATCCGQPPNTMYTWSMRTVWCTGTSFRAKPQRCDSSSQTSASAQALQAGVQGHVV